MTPAEMVLWSVLRDRKLDGLKFRRQQPLGGYVFDFYCPECRLLIELDGAGHDDPEQSSYDQNRSDQLTVYGYTALRFRNEQIFTNLDTVLAHIREHAQRYEKPDRQPQSRPLPALGEGPGGEGQPPNPERTAHPCQTPATTTSATSLTTASPPLPSIAPTCSTPSRWTSMPSFAT